MQVLTRLATPRLHTNVLQHMAGYFKDRLDAASKHELADTIEAGTDKQAIRTRRAH